MILIAEDRQALLGILPNDAVVAEIGVALGEYSEHILKTARPKRLHLIDSWCFQDDEKYKKDGHNMSERAQSDRYQMVLDRFAEEITVGGVKVHRAFSTEAVESFEDAYFDWIYLDANHTYEAVLQDLQLYLPKVKADGFICGHDYTNWPPARKMMFGVIEAVNDFVAANDLELLVLTKERYATYVLSRSGAHAAALKKRIGASLTVLREFPARWPSKFKVGFRLPSIPRRIVNRVLPKARRRTAGAEDFLFKVGKESFQGRQDRMRRSAGRKKVDRGLAREPDGRR